MILISLSTLPSRTPFFMILRLSSSFAAYGTPSSVVASRYTVANAPFPRRPTTLYREPPCQCIPYVCGRDVADTEVAVVTAQELEHPLVQAHAVATREEMLALKAAVRRVRISEELKHYIVELVRRTRSAPQVLLGCGPRASIALVQSAKALALLEGHDFVAPEEIQELAVSVLAHRMVLDPQAKFAGANGATLISALLRETKVPA